MPTIEVNKKSFLKKLGKELSDKEIEDRISMLGTSVEKVTNDTIEVEAFPNRPDYLSEEGLARALKGFLGLKTGLIEYKAKTGKYEATMDKSVKDVRSCVSCAVIKGVVIDEEMLVNLMQTQEKLHSTHSRNRKNASIGIYDLDSIEFPLKYTTVNEKFSFVPLEETKEMTIKQILEEHPKGKDYAHLVKGKKKYPIWLDANEEVLSFPPIINSAHTAVTTDTKNLFIDVTGLDQKTVDQAMNILVAQFVDAGGEVFAVKLNEKKVPELKTFTMKLDLNYVNKLLGLDLTKKDVKKLLEKMRFGVDDNLKVTVPCYRTDILHPMDLIEDIAIAYGYENFEEIIPNVSTIGEESHETIFERKVVEVMTGLGFLETNTYHLSNEDILLNKMELGRQKLVKTVNPANANYDRVRNNLLPVLMNILSENTHYEYPQNLFETGIVIDGKINEEIHVSAVMADAKTNFTEIKSVLNALSVGLGIEFALEESDEKTFMKGRVGKILVEGKEVGVMGEIHPRVLNNFGVEVPVAAFEINLSKLFN